MKFPVDAPNYRVRRAFQLLGFKIVQEGNHLIFEHTNPDGTNTPLVRPNHNTIKSSTLRRALTQAGIPRNEFIKAYEKS